MDDETLLNVKQVAQLLGRTRSTIFRIPEHELPFTTTSGGTERAGHRRYKRSDVDAYMGARTDKTLAERVASLEAWRAQHEAEHKGNITN